MQIQKPILIGWGLSLAAAISFTSYNMSQCSGAACGQVGMGEFFIAFVAGFVQLLTTALYKLMAARVRTGSRQIIAPPIILMLPWAVLCFSIVPQMPDSPRLIAIYIGFVGVVSLSQTIVCKLTNGS